MELNKCETLDHQGILTPQMTLSTVIVAGCVDGSEEISTALIVAIIITRKLEFI